MLMAVIAGVFFIITRIGMAGSAAYIVIAVKPEIFVVVIGCRFPCSGSMACCAVCGNFQVKTVLWLVGLVA